MEEKLEQIPCIWYSVTFKKRTEVLLELGNEANIVSQAFAFQLGFKIQKTNIRT